MKEEFSGFPAHPLGHGWDYFVRIGALAG